MGRVLRGFARGIKIVVINIAITEVCLRVLGFLMIAPDHLTHGTPLFVYLRKGIVRWDGDWGAHPVSHAVPGQTYKVLIGQMDTATERPELPKAHYRMR